MLDRLSLMQTASTVSLVSLCRKVIRALYSTLDNRELTPEDQEALENGIQLLDDVISFNKADEPETRAAAAFSGDVGTLRYFTEVAEDPLDLNGETLEKLRSVLSAVLRKKKVDPSCLTSSLQTFSRVNLAALDEYQRLKRTSSASSATSTVTAK